MCSENLSCHPCSWVTIPSLWRQLTIPVNFAYFWICSMHVYIYISYRYILPHFYTNNSKLLHLSKSSDMEMSRWDEMYKKVGEITHKGKRLGSQRRWGGCHTMIWVWSLWRTERWKVSWMSQVSDGSTILGKSSQRCPSEVSHKNECR